MERVIPGFNRAQPVKSTCNNTDGCHPIISVQEHQFRRQYSAININLQTWKGSFPDKVWKWKSVAFKKLSKLPVQAEVNRDSWVNR